MKENRQTNDTAALICRVREDDQVAFAALLREYEPLLHKEVSRHALGLGTQDVEDLRQVALLAFYRAAMEFDLTQSEVSFGLYAKILISRDLVSQLRVIGRRQPELTTDGQDPADGEDDLARRLMEREAAEALLARIQKLLSPYENRVWRLYMAGYSAREIARVVGKEPHSVENAVYRIRQKLRRELGERG
ncbi:MAG: sigma-70 family RNA polymerase sigma factor [Clostridia bacterium]|nr:sigma-70 family RNA polymerase sigma factor [Clostridia bacterium]